MTTRSGRTLGSPTQLANSRSSKSTNAKRNKSAKGGRKGVPVLTAPLSVLTEDYDIPVRDMGAWVNRPYEERMQEVEKKKGYVSRPMNSFMLYRSAYAERVKRFCHENNHQVVSQVTGASWPLEPQAIRQMYEQYAIIERDNHAAANPDYKFTPNKSGRKRGHVDDDDSDSDGEWGGSRSTKRSRRGGRDDTRSLSGTPFEPDRTYPLYRPAPQPQQHRSSYQALNPHGPPPYTFGPAGMTNGYYQTHTTPYMQNVEDIKFDGPYPEFSLGSSIIGMPDAGHHELLGGAPSLLMHDIPPEQMVDPRLAGLDPNYSYEHYSGTEEIYSVPRSFEYTSYPHPTQNQNLEPVHPGMTTLTESPSTWPESIQPGLDFDRELQGL
jgi:hypothetical protein